MGLGAGGALVAELTSRPRRDGHFHKRYGNWERDGHFYYRNISLPAARPVVSTETERDCRRCVVERWRLGKMTTLLIQATSTFSHHATVFVCQPSPSEPLSVYRPSLSFAALRVTPELGALLISDSVGPAALHLSLPCREE